MGISRTTNASTGGSLHVSHGIICLHLTAHQSESCRKMRQVLTYILAFCRTDNLHLTGCEVVMRDCKI